mgnify:CR=1 FL=1
MYLNFYIIISFQQRKFFKDDNILSIYQIIIYSVIHNFGKIEMEHTNAIILHLSFVFRNKEISISNRVVLIV